MSQAQIERFYAAAVKDPEMVAGLVRQNEKGDTFDEDGFVRSAVAKARELGYEFSHEEAQAWIKKQQETVASGELSDTQLEAVAGGGVKSAVGDYFSGYAALPRNTVLIGQRLGEIAVENWTGPSSPRVTAVKTVVNSAYGSVKSFFDSW